MTHGFFSSVLVKMFESVCIFLILTDMKEIKYLFYHQHDHHSFAIGDPTFSMIYLILFILSQTLSVSEKKARIVFVFSVVLDLKRLWNEKFLIGFWCCALESAWQK